jgi:hypothetical protein
VQEIENHAGEHQTHRVGHAQAARQHGNQSRHEQQKAKLRKIGCHAEILLDDGAICSA